jgi:tRNA-2-methylthio-N6-dimethylallyladenosine synthase
MPKTYFIKTLGCQANIADSNTMSGILEALGLEPLEMPVEKFSNETTELEYVFSTADLFIVNTCSVRQKSEDKAFGLGKTLLRVAREKHKKPFVVMSGCMVGSVTGDRQRYALDDLKKKTSWVDLYINPSQAEELPDKLLNSGFELGVTHAAKYLPKLDSVSHAYVNISNGCDNFCSYCVVPYARGREVSKSAEKILAEIQSLVGRGITEVTLCGQNVNSWGLNPTEKLQIRMGSAQPLPFVDLLREVHAIAGLEKIDFLSSNPFDFTQGLVDALALPKIKNYIHIAVQSGNNDVLKKMNRRHTVEQFIDLINRIKKIRPDMELGTDLIVGFPDETRAQFMDTVKLVQTVKFNVAFISMYSPRKGTSAERLYKDDVTKEEKKYRCMYLNKIWKESKKK